MRIKHLKHKKGTSVTEIMVSILIFSFMITGLYAALLAGNHSWAAYNASVKSIQQARTSLSYMTRELRVASNVSLTQDSSNVSLTFTHPALGAMSYTWTSDAGSTQNQVLRTTDSGTIVIGQDVTALSMTNNPDYIVVDLTVSGDTVQGSLTGTQILKKIALR